VGLELSSSIELGFRRCSANSSGDRRKLIEGIEGLPRVRQELAKGFRELARNG
ncbi:hypothetical protein B296_00040129, partial [Ensete ventricosum]